MKKKISILVFLCITRKSDENWVPEFKGMRQNLDINREFRLFGIRHFGEYSGVLSTDRIAHQLSNFVSLSRTYAIIVVLRNLLSKKIRG